MKSRFTTKFIYIFSSLVIILLSINNVFATPISITTNFIRLSDFQNTGIDLYLDKKSLKQDLSKGDFDLKLFFDGRLLIRGKQYPQNIKVEIYTLINGKKSFVSILNRTVKSNKAAENILLITKLPRIIESTELYFDIYDANNILKATYNTNITIDSSNFPEISETESIDNYDCQEGDGECLIEYILRNLSFSAGYDRNLKTEVVKNTKGRYTVSIPIKKGRTLKSKVRKIGSSGGKTNGIGSTKLADPYPYFQNEVEVASTYWDELKEALKIKFANSDNEFNFKKDGSLQLSTNLDKGFLNIGAGTENKAPIVFSQGQLLTDLVEGALEYDGQDLYFTSGSTRKIISQTGPQGPAGAPGPTGPAGPPGSGTAIDLSNGGFLNGNISFIGSSFIQDAVFNGSFQYKTGAQNGYVLTSNANGLASWQDISSLVNGSGLSSGIIGAIQFSDGASGFDSDENNFFWNNTTKRLGIGTNNPASALNINGGNLIINPFGSGNNVFTIDGNAFASTGEMILSAGGIHGQTITFTPRTSINSSRIASSGSGGLELTGTGTNIMITNNVGIGTTAPNAKLDIEIDSATEQGLILKSASMQTANLTEWQDFNGSNLLNIAPDGAIKWTAYDRLIGTGSTLTWQTPFAGVVQFIAGQVAQYMTLNLTTAEGKNAGMKHYDVANAKGRLLDIFSQPAVDITISPSENELIRFNGFGTADITSNANWDITSAYNGKVATIIRGANGQTANLSEWKDFNNNTVVSIANSGQFTIKDGTQANNYVLTSDANGLASWQDPISLLGSGASASGVTGAIQFSDGSSGFSSNGSKLFWNDTNGRLGIGINNPTADLHISGSNSPRLRLEATNTNFGYLTLNSTTFDIITNVNNTNFKSFADTSFSPVAFNTSLGGSPDVVTIRNYLGTFTNLVLRGGASQSANMTEWQNSTATVLSLIDNDGYMSINKASIDRANGAALDVNGSIFSTGFRLQNGTQANNYVLTSDANGLASWQNPSSLLGSGTSASGISGAIQFSDGSNGFNSDANNFFWDNTIKRLGIGTNNPEAMIDVGNGSANFIDGTQDLLVADDAEIDGNLYVNGSIFGPNLDNVIHRYITVPAFGGATGDTYEFISFDRLQGAHNFQITVTAAIASYSVSKQYIISTQYNQTAGVYQLLLPTTSTGIYSDDFDLDINVNNHTTTLRLRKKTGTIVGDHHIHIEYLGVADATIAELANTSAGVPKPPIIFEGNPLTQVNSKVGVNILDPIEEFSVNGSIQMRDGNQSLGYVMVSDALGVASWQDPTSLLGTGTSASGISGAIQFSDGSNGLISNATNLFWNNSTSQLDLTGSIEITNPANAAFNVLLGSDSSQRLTIDDSIKFTGGDRIYGSVSNAIYHTLGAYQQEFSTLSQANPIIEENKFNYITSGDWTPTVLNQAINIIHAEETMNSTANGTLVGIDTTLSDNSSSIENTVIGIKADVSGGTNISANRYAAILVGGNVGIETLNPQAALHINGNLMFTDGTQSNGYVLTSDANGLASWQNIFTVLNGGNFSDRVILNTNALSGGNLRFGVIENGVDTFGWQDINNGRLVLKAKAPHAQTLTITPRGNGGGVPTLESNTGQVFIMPTAGGNQYNGFEFSNIGLNIRNQMSPQRILLANFWSSASGGINHEYSYIGWNNNTFHIDIVNGGTGVTRNIKFSAPITTINGALAITDGSQSNGYVLTSDTNGLASWQDPASLLGSGASASGIAGAIQFSDGSNGFSSDANDLFWNSSTNRLRIGNHTPAINAPLQVQVDGAGTGFNIQFSPTEHTRFVSGGTFKGLMGSGSVPMVLSNSGEVRLMPGGVQTVTAAVGGGVGINNINPNSMLSIDINSSTQQGVILKGASIQTANLTEWQDINGNLLANISNEGSATFRGVYSGLALRTINSGATSFSVTNSGGNPRSTVTNGVWTIGENPSVANLTNAHGRFVQKSGGISRIATTIFSGPSIFQIMSNHGSGKGGTLSIEFASNVGASPVSTSNGSVNAAIRNNLDGDIRFSVAKNIASNGSAANLEEVVSITNGGNLGIGFTNPLSLLDINGSLAMRDGSQSNGYVLTSDANGLASWQDPGSLVGSGASASGIAGAIQFSDGSNGFNSNATSFFWNNTNGSLGIGTNVPNAPLTISKPTTITNQKFFTVTANGNEIASLQEGILPNYGGTLALKDADGLGNYVRLAYSASYPKLETNRTSLTLQTSTTQQRLASTYIDFMMGAQTPLIMQNVGPTATFTSTNSTNEVLIVKGAINQNNNLTEWQDRNGTQLLAIGKTGRIHGNASGRIDFVNSLNENAGIMIEPIHADGRIRMINSANPSSAIEFWHGGSGINIPNGTLVLGRVGNSVKWGAGWAGNSNNLRLDTSSTSGADAILSLRAERYADVSANGQPSLEIAAKSIDFKISNPSSSIGTGTTIAAITQNGKFSITDGTQINGYVFTSNINGEGSWQDPASLLGSGASGVTGAIQFSDGTNGFNSNAANLFWNNTNGSLGIGTSTPVTKFHLRESTGSQYIATFESTAVSAPFIRLKGSDREVTLAAQANALAIYGGLWMHRDGANNIWFTNGNQTQQYSRIGPDASGNFTIAAQAQTNKALIVKGKSSHTDSLTEWQDFNGITLSKITNAGNLSIESNSVANRDVGPHAIQVMNGASLKFLVTHDSAVTRVRQYAPNTSVYHYTDIGNSGSTTFTAGGGHSIRVSTGNLGFIHTGSNDEFVSGGAGWLLRSGNPTHTRFSVIGSNGQTADLTRWQDLNGNTLASISASGSIKIADGTQANGYVLSSDANGLASWKNPASLLGSATASGIAGAIQFSDGSNGFNSNAASFFWDNTNGALTASQVLLTSDGVGAMIRPSSGPGNLTISAFSTPNSIYISQSGNSGVGIKNGSSFYNPAATLDVRNSSTTIPVSIFRGAVSQTANLTEWQNGGGAVLSYFNNNGQLLFSNQGTYDHLVEFGSGYLRNDGVVAGSTFAIETGEQPTINSSEFRVGDTYRLGWTPSTGISGLLDTYFTRESAAIIQVGNDSVAAVNYTFKAGDGLGTDIAGASLTFAAGRSTGSATGGDLIFQTSNGSTSGASQNTLDERMRITDTGEIGIGESNPQRALHIKDVMRLEPRATAPAGPATGDIYIDSDGSQAACVYLNGAWVVMAGAGSCS